jgi:hypothetical protein
MTLLAARRGTVLVSNTPYDGSPRPQSAQKPQVVPKKAALSPIHQQAADRCRLRRFMPIHITITRRVRPAAKPSFSRHLRILPSVARARLCAGREHAHAAARIGLP